MIITPQEYRKTHHRCIWCKYKEFKHADMDCWYYCKVKQKSFSDISIWNKWRGFLCKVYKPKDLDFEV